MVGCESLQHLHLSLLQWVTKIVKPLSKPRTNSLVHNLFFYHYQIFSPWINLLLWSLMRTTISFGKINYLMPLLQMDWKISSMGIVLVQSDFLILKCKSIIQTSLLGITLIGSLWAGFMPFWLKWCYINCWLFNCFGDLECSQPDLLCCVHGSSDWDLCKDTKLEEMEYIKKLKHLCNTLATIGEPVSYIDHLLYLFGGLDRAYNLFVTLIINRPDKPSIEEIHSLLLSYEFRLDSQNLDDQLIKPTCPNSTWFKNLSNLIPHTLDMVNFLTRTNIHQPNPISLARSQATPLHLILYLLLNPSQTIPILNSKSMENLAIQPTFVIIRQISITN